LAHRIKDAALLDAIAKGIFPVSAMEKICFGRWSYRPHPQPDIGKEANANMNLYQNGLLNPMSYWTEDSKDPEKVADDMVRWAKIKRDKAAAAGFSVEDVFGAGIARPANISQSESMSTSIVPDPADVAKASEETLSEFAAADRGEIKASPKAPKSDTPNKNPQGKGTAKGDASGKSGARVTAEQEKTLQNKVDEFNQKESNTQNGKASLGALKSVFQRGLGAFNTSHSPVVKSANQWAFARVNAFLYLLKNGRPENEKYTTDFDLLPTGHPKSTK
jgi:hypothetical protein